MMNQQQMGNNNFFGNFQRFMQNPAGFLQLPQDVAKDPQAAIQHLMDTGKITQAQYNQARKMAEQLSNNPMFRQITGKRY